jgi:glycosyltransferase involved in cell wall biosynthesis
MMSAVSAHESQSVRGAPSVSVVVPAYNASVYIGAALDSVFAQTYTDYEVIVVNDGSPDTEELEKVLAPYRQRIAYVKQENRGPSGARNTAIGMARGRYVALLDSDDMWLPEYLEAQISRLEADPQLDLIYADALLFGDSALAGRTFMETAPSRGPVTFESLLRYEASIITTCTVARRQSLIDAGLFDVQFIRCEDFDLWIRLAHRGGRIAYQRRVVARHRTHGASLASDVIKMVESQIEVLKKARRGLPLSPAQRELVERQLLNCEAQINLERGKNYFVAGDYGQAAQALKRSNDFYQSRKLRLILWGLRAAPRVLNAAYRTRQNLSRRRALPQHAE